MALPAHTFPGIPSNNEVQIEGIAYIFCGLWISSVLACLCVTSQLNGPWFDSWWSLCLMGPEKKSTTESFGSPLDGGRPQVHHGKLWLSVGWWPTTGPPRKALALRWMVADHRSTTKSFGSPLEPSKGVKVWGKASQSTSRRNCL